ncbi:MAG: hypothetical protein NTY77_20605 [Elusimicrobia bacterium]|nr:hypothetical protein [Elusimicrobiota bacterium]
MIALLAALLASPVSIASAALAHSVSVELTDGRKTFQRTIRLYEDADRSGLGSFAQAPDPKQELELDAVVWPAGGRALGLRYRIGLFVPRRGMQEPIKMDDSGTVELPLASRVTVAECGSWKVTLSLDGGAAEAAWDAPGTRNYRLTAEASGHKWRQTCRHVGTPDDGIHLTEGHYVNGRQDVFGMIVNPLERRAGGFQVGYVVTDDTPLRPPLDARKSATLAPGRKTSVDANGYAVGLLLETSAGVAAPAPAAVAPQPAPQESKAVPLLR